MVLATWSETLRKDQVFISMFGKHLLKVFAIQPSKIIRQFRKSLLGSFKGKRLGGDAGGASAALHALVHGTEHLPSLNRRLPDQFLPSNSSQPYSAHS